MGRARWTGRSAAAGGCDDENHCTKGVCPDQDTGDVLRVVLDVVEVTCVTTAVTRNRVLYKEDHEVREVLGSWCDPERAAG